MNPSCIQTSVIRRVSPYPSPASLGCTDGTRRAPAHAPISGAGIDIHSPDECAALRQKFALALTRVLQSNVDIVNQFFPTFRLAHLTLSANYWGIDLATCGQSGAVPPSPSPSPSTAAVVSVSCPEGIPAFHATSPTVLLSRDIARYAYARSRFEPVSAIWKRLATWGVAPTDLSSFIDCGMGPTRSINRSSRAALEDPWNGRLVCLDDLMAWQEMWEQHAASKCPVESEADFAKSRDVDSRQFDRLTSLTCLMDLLDFHKAAEPLENFNRGHGGPRITRIERAPSKPPVYWLQTRCKRQKGE